MERSPLPLTTWFRAIRTIVMDPHCTARDLAAKVGMRRMATVRNLRRKISAALQSKNRATLLAGLDEDIQLK
jgi:hypothetical protein